MDGLTSLSRALNRRDEALQGLLAHAKSVTSVLSERAEQVNKLVEDGNQLFAALDARRAALSALISGIDDVAAQISGFVADNRKEFGPALSKLNLVLANLNERRDYITEALKRLPTYATTLGRWSDRTRIQCQRLQRAARAAGGDRVRPGLSAGQAAG